MTVRHRLDKTALTYALLQYSIACLMDEEFEKLNALGFTDADIVQLGQLTVSDLEKLSQAPKDFLHIRIDSEAFAQRLQWLQQQKQAQCYKERLIQHDAPQSLMEALYGMTSKVYAAYRKLAGLSCRSGRPLIPTQEEEQKVWEVLDRIGKSRVDELTPEDYLTLCQESEVSMRAIWQLLRNWVDEGLLH